MLRLKGARFLLWKKELEISKGFWWCYIKIRYIGVDSSGFQYIQI